MHNPLTQCPEKACIPIPNGHADGMHRKCEQILIRIHKRAAWLRVRRHGISIVHTPLPNCIYLSKKTYSQVGLSYQPFVWRHRRRRPAIPSGQEHEQCPEENFGSCHQERPCHWILQPNVCRAHGLGLHSLREDHARKTHEE